jgi:hypothetical protein
MAGSCLTRPHFALVMAEAAAEANNVDKGRHAG